MAPLAAAQQALCQKITAGLPWEEADPGFSHEESRDGRVRPTGRSDPSFHEEVASTKRNQHATWLLQLATSEESYSQLRQLLHTWSHKAEEELLDIYQVPEEERTAYRRYAQPVQTDRPIDGSTQPGPKEEVIRERAQMRCPGLS